MQGYSSRGMSSNRRRDEEQRLFLMRRRCDCGCNRYAEICCGPLGRRAKRLPDDRSKWRGLATACAEAEQQEAA
jgi:hypothetical protein